MSEKNSSLNLCKNIKLDRGHKNIIDNKNTLISYCQSNFVAFGVFYTYIGRDNAVLVNIPISQIKDCNYIWFENPSFENIDMFAFINSFTMINDSTTRIDYTVDLVHSYLDKWNILPCWVEREHTNNDILGLNILPEPLEGGELITRQHYIERLNPYKIRMKVASWQTTDNNYRVPTPTLENLTDSIRTVDTFGEYYFNFDELTLLQNTIQRYADNNRINDIVSIDLIPYKYSNDALNFSINLQTSSYIPKWEKTKQYPYFAIEVTGSNGSPITYRPELINYGNTGTLNFVENSDNIVDNCVVIKPTNYTEQNNRNYTIVIDGYPSLSVPISGSEVYHQLNDLKNNMNILTSFMSGGVGAISGNPIAMASGGISLVSTLNDIMLGEKVANPRAGSSISNSGKLMNDTYAVTCDIKSVSNYTLKTIDDYFTRYGYNTQKLKQPNTHTRTHFNYVRTRDSVVYGSCGENVLTEVENMLNAGVTFWHTTDIGNYNVSNDVI